MPFTLVVLYSIPAFDAIFSQLTDEGAWNAHMVTVYQFNVSFMSVDSMRSFIESTAHESMWNS
jgi:hypothetical protein